jgi:HlyD family secretion protein
MPASRRRLLWLILIPVLLVAAVFLRGRRGNTLYVTVAVDRGDIVDVVGATGLLQAVITVQVGSQVSGTISELGADFNSTVKKGQVIARLEPSSFQARVNQARANLASARANVERSQAAIDDAKQKFDRARELAKQDLLPPADLESARATYEGAVAQHHADEAAVKQAAAALNQAQVDLDHTVITAPVDGVVLARNVDVGQTVAASFQAPVLFVIANDLTRMQVNASIDEADIGRVKAGQDVTFTVDAFPDQKFQGRLEQVRLQPVTTQNVVTYNTIITVDNSQLKLMPGMTATVSVIVRSRSNVLRVPTSALRFRPEGFVDQRAASQRGAAQSAAAGGAAAPAGAPAGAEERRRTGTGGPGAGFGGARTHRPGGAEAAPAAGGDGRPGLIFVLGGDAQPKPTPVKLGISDGRFVEVVAGVDEGARVVTALESGGARPQGSASPGTTNPFTPQRPQPRNR